jgi:hypothetical protein
VLLPIGIRRAPRGGTRQRHAFAVDAREDLLERARRHRLAVAGIERRELRLPAFGVLAQSAIGFHGVTFAAAEQSEGEFRRQRGIPIVVRHERNVANDRQQGQR